MRSFALLVASAVATTELTAIEKNFMTYVVENGKSYGTKEEYEFRFNLFQEAEKSIANLNFMNTSATYGHNMFSDMTQDEKKKFLGYVGPQDLNEEDAFEGMPTADSVDWRTQGVVNPVKNQGQCGSCWAFSAVSAIESHHAISTGNLVSLSEQQVVDCDTTCYGCNGGLQSYAFKYAESHNIALESAYTYTAADGTCRDSSVDGQVGVTTYHSVLRWNSHSLLAAIEQGPVSVTVDAEQDGFMYYTGGVVDSSTCSGTSLDHAITAVGYGTENGQQYYIVRNSWGTSWGEEGYIRIATSTLGAGVCGIQQTSVWPETN